MCVCMADSAPQLEPHLGKHTKNQIFQEKTHVKNSRHSAKFQYFDFQFSAKIFILIVLSDSTMQILGYRRSSGDTSKKYEISGILKGDVGGVSPKNF